LKAVLASHKVEYPRTHDIDRLVDLLAGSDVALPPQARRLDELTPWATQLRYDELLDIEHLDRNETIQLVEGVINWAEAAIETSPTVPDTD
ncbi:MAG: HEPN domain-containing protein, partial [Gammaproteobacteria bacterium]